MKSAEEWCEQQVKDPEANAIDWVKQIQLDAWKQGMIDAAEAADDLEPSGELKIGSTIRATAEETTEL